MITERKQIQETSVIKSIAELSVKLTHSLREKGHHAASSRHEILGLLNEEFHELTDAVQNRGLVGVTDELMDIAVVAIFGVASIKTGVDW